MHRASLLAGLTIATLAAGCATQPLGPTARVMPAQGKPFEVFAADQATCKQFAEGETGGGSTIANLKQLGTLALTTALGAGLGEAVHRTRGAELGGAMGAVAGGTMLARGSARDQNDLQGRYDLAYTQCMYARGNQVAGAPAMPRIAFAPGAGMPMGLAAGPGMAPGTGYSPGPGGGYTMRTGGGYPMGPGGGYPMGPGGGYPMGSGGGYPMAPGSAGAERRPGDPGYGEPWTQ